MTIVHKMMHITQYKSKVISIPNLKSKQSASVSWYQIVQIRRGSVHDLTLKQHISTSIKSDQNTTDPIMRLSWRRTSLSTERHDAKKTGGHIPWNGINLAYSAP
jgi:hypothetical protein